MYSKLLLSCVLASQLIASARAQAQNPAPSFNIDAVLGTVVPVALILMIVAVIFIIRYYRKLKEVRRKKKQKDAQEMVMMRQRFGHRSPHSAISSISGSRVGLPEILVNGQPDPEMATKLGKADWTWGPENGQVKRPTPALPGPNLGVAKKVSKKKMVQSNSTGPQRTSMYTKNNPRAEPFEDQVMSVDLISEPGMPEDQVSLDSHDNDAFENDNAPTDRETFLMHQFSSIGQPKVRETHVTSQGGTPALDPETGVPTGRDFVAQCNEDEITSEVNPTNSIASEVYFNKELYKRMEKHDKPRQVLEEARPALPEAEITLELVEMQDFSSLVYAADIEAAYANIPAERPLIEPPVAKPVNESKNLVDFNIQCTEDDILASTLEKGERKIEPPKVEPAKPPPVVLPMSGPPPPQQPYQQQQWPERPKSVRSTKSSKSNKSSKSDKSNKSNKSKKKKMVRKKDVPKVDFMGQCEENEISKATGSKSEPIYAEVRKSRSPRIPPKKQEKPADYTVQVTQAEIPIQAKNQPKRAYDFYPVTPEDPDSLEIPDISMFDIQDEEALRHHAVRLKKHEHTELPDSPVEEHHLSTDAEEKVNAIFASIFQDHSRLTSDSSEDELEKTRPTRPHPPDRSPALTQAKLIDQHLKNEKVTHQPQPSASRVGPNVEPDRLRHDEKHEAVIPGTDAGYREGRDIAEDYAQNWNKLTDDTIPSKDY